MSDGEVFELDPARPELAAEGLAAAARALAAGRLVVLPTETVYGIASRPDLPDATDRLFEAKQRPRGLSLPVLASSVDSAWDLAIPNSVAQALAGEFWPGPLTMVLPRTERSAPWHLGEERDSIAVRVPAHRLSVDLLGLTGPLAATSANLSGRPPLSGPAELRAAFDDRVAVYLVFGPGAPPPGGIPSTVVDLTVEPIRVLRGGAIERQHLLAVAGSPGEMPTR